MFKFLKQNLDEVSYNLLLAGIACILSLSAITILTVQFFLWELLSLGFGFLVLLIAQLVITLIIAVAFFESL